MGSTITSAGRLTLDSVGSFAGTVACTAGAITILNGAITGTLTSVSGCSITLVAASFPSTAFTNPIGANLTISSGTVTQSFTNNGRLTLSNFVVVGSSSSIIGGSASVIVFNGGSTLAGSITTAGTLTLADGCGVSATASVTIQVGGRLFWYAPFPDNAKLQYSGASAVVAPPTPIAGDIVLLGTLTVADVANTITVSGSGTLILTG